MICGKDIKFLRKKYVSGLRRIFFLSIFVSFPQIKIHFPLEMANVGCLFCKDEGSNNLDPLAAQTVTDISLLYS